MRDAHDVVVTGGGPAGHTAAGLVAQAGHSALLVEREKFPRFHMGESLMPACYWPVQRLGLIERMKASNFTPKKSVQFVAASGKESPAFYSARVMGEKVCRQSDRSPHGSHILRRRRRPYRTQASHTLASAANHSPV